MADVTQLKEALGYTLSNDKAVRSQAEEYLKSLERSPEYPLKLLRIVQDTNDVNTAQIASVAFKNFIKKNWVAEEAEVPGSLPEAERTTIKTHIVTLMCSTHPRIQSQVSEALSLISVHDFPAKWQNLLPELVSKCQSQNWEVINGVLMTANSIFKRFRYAFKSDELFLELKYCLEQFQAPLLELFAYTWNALTANANNKVLLARILSAARLLARIFFSLNWQDLPEFFENHIDDFAVHFERFLTYSNPLMVDPDEEDEAGPIESLQAAVVENLILYSSKYLDDWKVENLQKFTQHVWNLATRVSSKPKDDVLITTCIRFLTSVVSQASNKAMFQDENALKQICHSIVAPNMMLREEDEDLFESNPMDYIRRDIEGSDSDTRKRSACDLVRGLCKHFQDKITSISQEIITKLLQDYARDKNQWKAKDAAINLAIALAVKAQTKSHGATQINDMFNVMEFFTAHIYPELQSADFQSNPILKADAIKFVSTFRTQIPANLMMQIIPLLIRLMQSDQFVVHTYAAACVERVLTVKDKLPNGRRQVRFTKQTIQPFMQPLFTGLFGILERPNYPENDYIMRAVMRVINVAQEDIVAAADIATNKLTAILARVCSNPTNPLFSHYLFESISALVRNVAKVNPAATARCEELLFPPFQTVLSMDVESLAPYVFQVLAQLLEYRPDGLSPAFASLLPPLMAPAMWERRANIPAMSRLIVAYVRKSPEHVTGSLTGILGIFQKLIASRVNESYGFEILRAIFSSIPLQHFQNFVQTILQILMTRLQSNMNQKYIKDLLLALSVLAGKHGALVVVQGCESLQAGMFAMLFGSVWVPNISKTTGDSAKKAIVIGTTRILTETPAVLDNQELFGKAIDALVTLLESSEDKTDAPDEDEEDDIEELADYSAGYSKLHFASEDQADVFSGIPHSRAYLAKGLADASKQSPGKVTPALSLLPARSQTALQTYLTQAGVRL